MREVSVTELRNHLQAYLGQVQKGDELAVTSRGKVIALIVPGVDDRRAACERLATLRDKCRVGDVITPIEETWEAEGADS